MKTIFLFRKKKLKNFNGVVIDSKSCRDRSVGLLCIRAMVKLVLSLQAISVCNNIDRRNIRVR